MDLSKLIGKKQNEEVPQTETPRLSKEEYAAQKKAERDEVWGKVDTLSDAVFAEPNALKSFLDFTAQCNPQRTANLLLLHWQNLEVRQVRTFDKWKEIGRSVRTGEKGYVFIAGQEYERDDGTKDSGYQISKAFDIAQTKGRQPPAADTSHEPDELLTALVESSPTRLELSDGLPEGVQAQYVPQRRTIYLKNGMDTVPTFCALAREQAHAAFDLPGSGYQRKLYAAQSYCAAYVTAKRFGLDTAMFRFDKVCSTCSALDPQSKRLFLSDVKNAAYTMRRRMEQTLSGPEQAMEADAYALAGVAEAKPAEKAAKGKTAKQAQR